MHLKSAFTSLLAAGLLLSSPASSLAGKSHHGHHGHHGGSHGHHHHNHGHHYYHSSYRPYWGGWGWGWYRPYWYPGATVSISTSSSSRYSSADGLAVNVQRALRSRGYYKGPLDGNIGSGSRSAIRAYQREHGLTVSGRIDTALVRSLRIG